MSQVRNVLFPVFILSNCFGTIPFTFRLKFSRILLAVNMCTVIIPAVVSMRSALRNLRFIDRHPSDVTLTNLASVLSCLATIGNIYFTLNCTNPILSIVKTFEEVDKILKGGPDLRKTRIAVLFLCFVSFSSWPLFLGIKSNATSSMQYFLNCLAIANSTSMHSIGLQFNALCVILSCYLSHLNCEIDKLKSDIKCKSSEILIRKVEDLRNCHDKLCENANLINKTYGPYLLAPFLYSSLYTQTDIFNIVVKILDTVYEAPVKVPRDPLGFFLWVLVDVMKICGYFISTHFVYAKVKKLHFK
jgi:hypothetical protein